MSVLLVQGCAAARAVVAMLVVMLLLACCCRHAAQGAKAQQFVEQIERQVMLLLVLQRARLACCSVALQNVSRRVAFGARAALVFYCEQNEAKLESARGSEESENGGQEQGQGQAATSPAKCCENGGAVRCSGARAVARAQCHGARGRCSSSLALSMAASMWMTMGLSPAAAAAACDWVIGQGWRAWGCCL